MHVHHKHTMSYIYTIGIRYITNQSPSLPLLQVAADSAQEEAEDVEGESYEMKSMARESYSKESHFDKGWRWTTTV